MTKTQLRDSNRLSLKIGFLSLFAAVGLAFSANAQVLDESAPVDVSAEVPPATFAEAPGHLEIKVGKSAYSVDEPAIGEADREAFEGMSEADKIRFATNRKIFLGATARSLHLTKYGFGVGSIVGEKVVFAVKAALRTGSR